MDNAFDDKRKDEPMNIQTGETTMETINLKSYGKGNLQTFRVLTLADVIAWTVATNETCESCHGSGQLDRETYKGPCGRCNGTGTMTVNHEPSHVWFISTDGSARQAKVNGKIRTWKRDKNRIEVPMKYGLYEYATFDSSDIQAGRLVQPV